jgi:hypothetical protein
MPQTDYTAIADILTTAAVTIAAAFFGAKYAFELQNKKAAENQVKRQLEDVNLALFTLIRNHNFFLNVKSQLVGEFEGSPNRHHFIKPLTSIGIDPPTFDYAALSFLLDVDANLFFRLSVLQQDLTGTFQMIRDRSMLHADHLQPVVEAVQAASGSEYISVQDVEDALGMRKTLELKQATDYMVNGINRGIEDTKALANQLRDAVKTIYPKAKTLVIMEPRDNPQ